MIRTYFATLKETARNFKGLRNFILLKEFVEHDKGFIRFKMKLKDDSEIHVFEYVKLNIDVIDYSYHWQDKDKNLIMRWDNAPHHPQLDNFPHHIHKKNQIKTSKKPALINVLRIIEGHLK